MSSVSSHVMKFLREPLVHFLIAGALLFAAYATLDRDAKEDVGGDVITVGPAEIDQLSLAFSRSWMRSPTPTELSNLINEFVLDEVYYRQALAMGLEQGDTIIRRRLRQKLEFITEDATFELEPTDDELQTYLIEHPEKFRRDMLFDFEQVYINPEKHGENVDAYFKSSLAKLNAGDHVDGDSDFIPREHVGASARGIDRLFGLGFSAALTEIPVGEWHGPVGSGLGLHIVRITSREPGKLPSLEEARLEVEREWVNEKRLASREAFNDRLREQYTIVVEMPGPSTNAVQAGSGQPN